MYRQRQWYFMNKDRILEIFAKNVEKYRKQKGLSIEELAILTGIRYKYLCKIESAIVKRLTTNHLFLIAKALEIESHKFVLEDSGV